MPYQEMPKFKAVPDKMLEIPQPAYGGLNLRDLEFEQDMSQSPNMMNVMYRNGAFGKRYGQEIHSTYSDEVFAATSFDNDIFVHAGDGLYRNHNGTITSASVYSIPRKKGNFIIYAQKLYYLVSKDPGDPGQDGFYVFDKDDEKFKPINAHIPTTLINCKPDGTHADPLEDFNIMSDHFSIIYNGDGTSTEYNVGKYDSNKVIDWNGAFVVEVDDVEIEQTQSNPPEAGKYYVNSQGKKIKFGTAPSEGDLNVKMTFTLKNTTFSTERGQILSCKYHDTFGGSNNNRLFLAGCGNSKYYYSDAYDITSFPENNFGTIGNTEEDITGFGRQYNVLIIFKPKEIYSLYSFTENSTTTLIEENYGKEGFKTQLVNASVGCDAPYSIQLVNNLLTWFNSNEGICTLASTNIQDERNVRVISRNIDFTNNFGIKGILDYNDALDSIQSVDYENRYFLVFPESGICFMWDYEIMPFVVSSRGDTDPKKLSWFIFDHFYVRQFLKVGTDLLYVGDYDDSTTFTLTQLQNFGEAYDWALIGGTGTVSVEDEELSIDVLGEAKLKAPMIRVRKGHWYYFSVTVVPGLITGKAYFEGIKIGNGIMPRRYSFLWYAEENEAKNLTFDFNITFQLSHPIVIKELMAFDVTDIVNRYQSVTSDFIDTKIPDYVDYNDTTSYVISFDNTDKLIKLNSSFEDLDFDGDGNNDPICSHYMTPFLQFSAVEWLKNVRFLYVQCRGDVNSLINIYYYTNDSEIPEKDPESIETGGKGFLWGKFKWSTFHWAVNSWANTFRRKCNLKKIQMAAFYFDNDEVDKDMSITHLGMQYQIVKYVR